MEIDDLDRFIVNGIYDGYKNKYEVTTWTLSKMFLNISDVRKLTLFCNKIRGRLEDYARKGYVLKLKNSQNKIKYVLNLDAITISKHRFSDGYKKVMILRL